MDVVGLLPKYLTGNTKSSYFRNEKLSASWLCIPL